MKEKIYSLLPPGHPWGEHLHYFESVDSTNTLAKAMAEQGAPHGTILIADHQTGGRGRRGRSFHSPAGAGIYMSVILRPHCGPGELMHLTCAAAVAMCDAVEKTAGFRPDIKWINDLVVGKQKLAGILTELGISTAGTVNYAVVGIGINCEQEICQFPEDIRDIATSISMATGRHIDRAVLAAAMIQSLENMDRDLLPRKDAIMESYRQNCITLGREISVIRGDEIRHGLALDLDKDGGLIVKFESGRTETVSSGDVSIRGMYGYL